MDVNGYASPWTAFQNVAVLLKITDCLLFEHSPTDI
jgi:hypothetical protein